jgi:hypothetical protein
MSAWQFTAPGGLNDFSDPKNWHQAMLKEANGIVDILVQTVLGRSPASQAEYDQVAATLAYINPAINPPPSDAATVAVTPWGGFPRAVKIKAPWPGFPPDVVDADGSYRAADQLGAEDYRPGVFVDRHGNVMTLPSRHRQDEYLEWVLRRDTAGRIRTAIFVAEGYDYFSKLYEVDERRVVEIYQEFTETRTINADDLRAPEGIYFRDLQGRTSEEVTPGGFNHRNRFNVSPGIIHLSHRANSLGAEVNLAGVSGIARRLTSGELLDGIDERRLLCCAQGGEPNRNSDPLISKQAYAQVMAGKHYTLANPVGLYIATIAHEHLLLPDGVTPAPEEWWRTVRGTSDDQRVLRLELEVPANENFVVGDLSIDGVPLKFGGQLAELLTMHLFVTIWNRAGGGSGPAVPCEATCCVKSGTDILVISDGNCQPGYVLKYPGLVETAGRRASFAEAAAAVPALQRVAAKARRLP